MHVKFIARGTGSAKAAVDYLLGERDAAGQPRDGVEVRRGDPDHVAAHDPESGERWRLKGALYEQDFSPERFSREAAAEAGDRPQGDRAERHGGAAAAWRELEQRCEERAAFHRSRYAGEDRADADPADARAAVLNENIKQACRTLAMLQTTMGSVERREIDSKRSGVLPAGSLEHPPWTVVGRPAVRLSSE